MFCVYEVFLKKCRVDVGGFLVMSNVRHFRTFVYCAFCFFAEFDRHEILLYEEVAKVPPFKRKTLILIGAQGVGRRRLKAKLLLRDPELFGTTIPCMNGCLCSCSVV